MTYRLKNQRALVTGASSGIGMQIARRLTAAGCDVVLTARRTRELESLARELRAGGVRASVVTADLADPGRIDSLVEAACRELGGIDILVNNAGMTEAGLFWKKPDREWQRVLQLDFLTPIRLMHAFLPGMVERDRGCIVNISSIAGLLFLPTVAHYAASKAGLAAASESVRADLTLRKSRVGILVVYPGPIHSQMLDKAKEDPATNRLFSLLPHGSAEEIGRLTVRAVEREERMLVYPRVFHGFRLLSLGINRGFSALSRVLASVTDIGSRIDTTEGGTK
ncbi:MAG: SDR family NAD(P)-dependent oxidoreductase [Pseudomonadota bacterium]